MLETINGTHEKELSQMVFCKLAYKKGVIATTSRSGLYSFVLETGYINITL